MERREQLERRDRIETERAERKKDGTEKTRKRGLSDNEV